ncbi:MAG TPA: VCBS repeat-containing protein, partial [Rhodothermales bacterium]|nr:VCBS repeat-containing protein [Rhodothermales bacterium]
GDFDGDGDLDVIFVSEDDVKLGRTGVHEFYLNDGRGVFSAAPFRLPDSESNAIAVADVDRDGKLDLAIGNAGQDFLLLGNGDGTFRDVTATHLPSETLLCQDLEFADVDRDGDLDLVLGNEDGNRLLLNDGTGRFTDATADRLGALANMETRKVTVADVDGDGDIDLFFANVTFIQGKDPRSRLYLNDGAGRFTDATATHLPAGNTIAIDAKFVDAEGDGDLDLVLGRFPQNQTVRTLVNDGQGRFADGPLFATVTGDALAIEVADLNGDRRPDLYFAFRAPFLRDKLLFGTRRATGIGEAGRTGGLELFGPVPNPFSWGTTLSYALVTTAAVGFELFDAAGRRVAHGALGVQGPGRYRLPWTGDVLAPGLYVGVLRAGAEARTWTMTRLVD